LKPNLPLPKKVLQLLESYQARKFLFSKKT
jgi:hypothetical protein